MFPESPHFAVEVVLSEGRTSYAPLQRRPFATILADAWQRIPADVRETLTARWRGIEHPIFLTDRTYWNCHEGVCECIGTCGQGGRQLSFCALFVATFPQSLVTAAIAHECAHAWRHATRKPRPATWEEDEAETDQQVEAWGFPMKELREFWGWAATEAMKHELSLAGYARTVKGWGEREPGSGDGWPLLP
jgi:hypothetical protein